ncbi:MFS transporter [Varunaivibrio sulfuroxidans]|uniref:Putative MFS family arabinose efflux permease n=1 Tax=Varunaivibrio sulfuroxidans TaxID=1773489 RepID=A0A4R3JF86_9PROT|nr:MFS transporter [Varunaivibrio sulfuroxidans]TCS64758.1 putative MFS family arabinose efflux permease [Varunaivibrio sulfuroxidans]WES29937.1 MFS transporter [Varunaivibrio sulfuroxidans]
MSERSPRPARKEIILLTIAAILVVGQTYIVISLFAPMAVDFARPAASLAVTVTVFGIPYAFAGLLAGPLADVWGAKKVIVLSLVASALTTLIVAVAPGFAMLILLRALQGFTAGFFAAPVFTYIARDLHEEVRAFATTAIQAGALASAVLMQLFGQVIEVRLGWRFAFFIPAPVILGLALAAERLLARSSGAAERHVGKALLALPDLLLQWRLLALYGAALTLLGGFVAVLSGLSLYGPQDLRADPTRLFLVRASALPVMLAVPFLVLRLGRLSLRARIFSGLGLSALSLAVTALAAEQTWALAGGLAACVAGILIAAPAIVQGVAQAAPESSGAAVSIYAFTIFLGASLGPQFAALLAPTGMVGLLLSVATLLAVGSLFGVIGAKTTKQS